VTLEVFLIWVTIRVGRVRHCITKRGEREERPVWYLVRSIVLVVVDLRECVCRRTSVGKSLCTTSNECVGGDNGGSVEHVVRGIRSGGEREDAWIVDDWRDGLVVVGK